MRRWGEAPERGRTYRRRPGAYAVLLRGAEVLLTVQAGGAADGGPEVQLPGGGLDPGEGQLQALRREVLEETGWTLARPRRLGAFRRFRFMPEYGIWAEKVCHVWLARPARQVADPTEPDHMTLWAPGPAALRLLDGEAERAFLARALGPGRGPPGDARSGARP